MLWNLVWNGAWADASKALLWCGTFMFLYAVDLEQHPSKAVDSYGKSLFMDALESRLVNCQNMWPSVHCTARSVKTRLLKCDLMTLIIDMNRLAYMKESTLPKINLSLYWFAFFFLLQSLAGCNSTCLLHEFLQFWGASSSHEGRPTSVAWQEKTLGQSLQPLPTLGNGLWPQSPGQMMLLLY